MSIVVDIPENRYTPLFAKHLKVYTNCVVEYNQFLGEIDRHRLTTDKTKSKQVSANSVRKINKVINFMVDSAKDKRVYCKETKRCYNFRLGFLTLTLSSNQLIESDELRCNNLASGKLPKSDFVSNPLNYRWSDDLIKSSLLNQFLTELRSEYGVVNYIWKAESQKRGAIHFHIIIDKFIWHTTLSYIWNRIQNKLGIIDEFEQKYNHRNPPSIDIHAIKDVKNLRKYFSKYLTKEEPLKRDITGRVWGCNYELSRYKGVDILLERDVFKSEFIYLKNNYKLRSYINGYISWYDLNIGQIANIPRCQNLTNEIVKQFLDIYNLKIEFKN